MIRWVRKTKVTENQLETKAQKVIEAALRKAHLHDHWHSGKTTPAGYSLSRAAAHAALGPKYATIVTGQDDLEYHEKLETKYVRLE